MPCISLVSHLYRALYLTCISPVTCNYNPAISFIVLLQDLAGAVILAFKDRSTSYVSVTVLYAVHHWINFFDGFVPPLEKVAAHVPDIERPHRFEFWYNSVEKNVELWYKNLRAQDKYWNSEPIIMLPKGYKPLSDLVIATAENDTGVLRHLRGLAKIQLKFMKLFDLRVPAIEHLLGDEVRQHWETWFGRFAHLAIVQVWNEEEQKFKTSKVSKLKDDLSEINTFMQNNAKPIEMLSVLSSEVESQIAIPVKKHTCPPVAPIRINKKGWDSVNADLDHKFLAAFIAGASDHECVHHARKTLAKAVQAQKPAAATKSQKRAKPSKSAADMVQAVAQRKLAAENPSLADAAAESVEVDDPKAGDPEYSVMGVFGVSLLEWFKTNKRSKQKYVDMVDYHMGLQWDPAALEPNELQHSWQSIAVSNTSDDEIAEHLQNMIDAGGSENASIVLVKWEGGGYDCWVPGKIVNICSNEMHVIYEIEEGARVQKEEHINICNLEYNIIVKGSHNPKTRKVGLPHC